MLLLIITRLLISAFLPNSILSFFFLRIRRPPRSPLFPSTTLFRSLVKGQQVAARAEKQDLDPDITIGAQHVTRVNVKPTTGLKGIARHGAEVLENSGCIIGSEIGRAHV